MPRHWSVVVDGTVVVAVVAVAVVAVAVVVVVVVVLAGPSGLGNLVVALQGWPPDLMTFGAHHSPFAVRLNWAVLASCLLMRL